MTYLTPFFTILTIGAIGAIVYTVFTHPDGIKAITSGADALFKTSYAAELGKVA